jgi:mannonate dehydratase
VPEVDRISEDHLWANYVYFIERVLPVAEAAGVKMSLHPDDPPLSPLRGVGRIFSSPAGFRRALALSPSPAHNVTFCQANFLAMGAEVAACAREFAPRIAFVHFRDVRGTRESFEETFHDDGPTDMAGMLKLYHDLGLDVPIRADHVPSLVGEEDLPPGYAYLGRLFAIGYMKGIMHAHHIPFR